MAGKREVPDQPAVRCEKHGKTVWHQPEPRDTDEPRPSDREKLAQDERAKFEEDAMRERDA